MPRKIYSFENFDIDVNSSSMLFIIIGIAAGLMLGITLSLIYKTASGKIVKALSASGSDNEENAKTMHELGLEKVKFAKNMLKPGSPLFKSVGCVGGFYTPEKISGFSRFWHEKFIREEIPQKFDYSTARFYLPEEKRVSAEIRFAEEKHPIRNFILSAVLLTAVCFFAVYAIPELLTMLDNFLTQVKG